MSQSIKPHYQVIYNQDCTHLFGATKEPITPGHVEQMVDEVADGGADALMVNPNSQLANYPSKVWQSFWDGYVEGDRGFFGDVSEDSIERREHCIKQMKRLAGQCDYLATVLARCRQRSIAAGVSIRMNDSHDVPWPDSHMFSRFYNENPQFLLDQVNARDWGTAGLDYQYPEVRQHYLALIREVVGNYDLDVLELDFSRFSYYFNRGNAQKYCRIMNEFIAQVRELPTKADRVIHLIPRVPTNPNGAYQLGFDVQTWAKEELVDGITVTASLGTCWNMPIDEFRALVGPDVAIYAGADVSADRRDGLPVRHLPGSREMLRGFAAGYLAAGADGVEVFNYFCARGHHDVSAEEFFAGLAEMKSLNYIRCKPRIHVLDASYWNVEFDMPEQAPVTVQKNTSRGFEMFLAAAPESVKVSVLVYYEGQNKYEDLWLRIGCHDAGHAVEIQPGPEGDPNGPGRLWHYDNEQDACSCRKSKIAVFNVPVKAIKDGRNKLVVRSENMSTTILGIDVCIG